MGLSGMFFSLEENIPAIIFSLVVSKLFFVTSVPPRRVKAITTSEEQEQSSQDGVHQCMAHATLIVELKKKKFQTPFIV